MSMMRLTNRGPEGVGYVGSGLCNRPYLHTTSLHGSLGIKFVLSMELFLYNEHCKTRVLIGVAEFVIRV